MLKRRLIQLDPEHIAIPTAVLLAFLHGWMGRHSMNPDGVSYLDVGDAFIQRHWAVAVNAWWSPLYAWTLGIVLHAFKPSPRWEFPLVQLVNFAVFLVVLLSFRFFLQALLQFIRQRRSDVILTSMPEVANLPDWVITIVGYGVFLWASLEIVTSMMSAPILLL